MSGGARKKKRLGGPLNYETFYYNTNVKLKNFQLTNNIREVWNPHKLEGLYTSTNQPSIDMTKIK